MWKNECSKFKANIFNKQKCANCYKTREQHSQDALEFNRLTRVVSKCGYLFVAPNWDFSNPIYRTKRWQRRFFILYEDGELTYSVDDHPDTIPQAIINLNTVYEITEADAITGNDNSIAVVANDGIHFLKGSCREESRLWRDILRLFPQAAGQTRQTIGGTGSRAKRSATFPGLRSLPGGAGGPAAQQRLQMAAATNNYNKHLVDSQVGSDGTETHLNDEHDSSSDTIDGVENTINSGKTDKCYDDSGLPPTPPTTSPPDSSPENSPALKSKKISSGLRHDPVSNKQFVHTSILKNSQITTSTPTSYSFSQSATTKAMPPTIKKSLSTLSPSAILESNNIINDSERYRDTNRNNNNVSYKSPYQRYERSKTTSDFSSALASSSVNTRSSSISEKRNTSVINEALKNDEKENDLSEHIRASGNNNTSFSSVSHTNALNSVMMADRNSSASSSLNIDNLSANNSLTTMEDSMEENIRNMSSIGSRISSAMNRKRTSLSSSPYSGLSSSMSLTTPSVGNSNSRRSTSLLSSLPPHPSSVRLPLSSPLRSNGLSKPSSSQVFGSNSSEVHKSSITSTSSSSYMSMMNNNSLQEEESLPEPPTESRGTPDGCGLDNPSELLNKKGWLMKQGLTKEWHKYWFVLQDVALLYYRDPKAESKGFLDGIIDLSQVQRIDKQELPRHFGFYIKTYEGKTTVFSAITDGIRKNWIASLQKAANVCTNATSNDNNDDNTCSNNGSSMNMRKRSSINEMDVITTTRIVRASTTTPPSLTKVPSLPPPLTLQTSTTTMTFSTEVFDDEEDEETTDDDEDYDSEDCEEESEDEIDGPCLVDNKDNTKTDHTDLMKNKEDDNVLKSSTIDDIVSSNHNNNTDGVLVDLLETEVDSLKAQLEKTQSELYSLHHSNISRGHSASSSSHSSLQSMNQQQQYIVPSSNTSSLSSLSNNNNLQQQVQTPVQQSSASQHQQQQQTLSTKRYNNNSTSVPSSSSNQVNQNQHQQSTIHTQGVNAGEECNYSSSHLHLKAQQHKQQLQQQQQLVEQLSKDHTETLSQLNKTKSTIAKQTVEISSLKTQIKQNQIQIKQNLQSLQGEKETNIELKEKLSCFESTVNSLREKLQLAEESRDKECEKISDLRHEYECNLGKLETEVDKWKLLHESLYLQYNRELHSWEDRLASLENDRIERESTLEDDQRAKDRVISDLSEQLKESDDRIQELLYELEAARDSNETFADDNQESFSRLVVSMEEKFAASLKSEKEQLEVAFRERLREHELYEHEQRLVTADVTASASTFGNCFSSQQLEDQGTDTVGSGDGQQLVSLASEGKNMSGKGNIVPPLPSPSSHRNFIRRPSLLKINSMSDLLDLKVPSMEAIETMEREDMTEKFLILLHHFYASVDEIRKLRVRLRESQDANDALEIDKMRFEESFKRTIVMQEQQENSMSKKIQDLTGKLLSSEKTARQLKDMMSSSSHRKHSRRSERKDSKNAESVAAAAKLQQTTSSTTNC